MKRPPGLWLLLSAGVLCLTLQNVYALRATELIFGKTSTTTTTTENVSEGEPPKEGVSTETNEVAATTTKSNITGNPQVDYIYDPNLPRELNGYNLSSYPFYNSMPEDITFKCDGLHDGFYASVPHKCQVYHHCLFGTRFDFLCANYTAFDQKTFICHFVSEVDCNNSHKYWHRNDALYQAATTTTLKPATIVISPALTASPRRPSPLRPRRPSRRRPQYDYYDEEYEDEATREDYYEEPPPRRRRKRPRPRPRPVYDDDYEDYEEDRYERRGSSRRNNDGDGRRRDYDDRHGDKDRKPYDRRDEERRGGNDDDKTRVRDDDRRDRNDDRKPLDRDYDRRDSDDRRSGNNNDRKPQDRREPEDRRSSSVDSRKPNDRRDPEERDNRKPHDRRTDYDDRRYKDDRRRDHDDRPGHDKDDDDLRYDRDRRKDEDRKRRPAYEDNPDDRDDRRPIQDKRPSSDRRFEKRRPADEARLFDRPRKTHRRPYDDDLYEDEKDDRRGNDRPRKNENRDEPQPQDSKQPTETEVKPLVKPGSTSSVFNQPRMAPRIRPPVPKTEQNKYAYKTMADKPVTKKTEDDVEYYEDYEEESPPKRPPPRSNRKPEPETTTEGRRPTKPAIVENDDKRENRRPVGSASRSRVQMTRRPPTEVVEEEYEEEKPKYSRPHPTRPRYNPENKDKPLVSTRNRSNVEEEYVDEETEKPPRHPTSNRERGSSQSGSKFITKQRSESAAASSTTTTSTTTITTTTTSTTTTTTKEPPRERPEPIVRVVKRPFLPSRGGNPYSSRGLQPVGAKALDNARNIASHTERTPLETSSDILTDDEKPLPEEQTESKQTDATPLHIEEDETSSSYKPTDNHDADEIQNGRRFPTEPKVSSFLINEQPVENYRRRLPTTEEPTKALYDDSLYRTSEETEQKQAPFKPSPVLVKVPVRSKFSSPIGSEEDEDEFRPVSNRPLRPNNKPRTYQEGRTTERPNIPERNPLDINENEYDVTLNDALNPTIPNLPVRNFPSGFSAANDYTYSNFHRPRYDVTLNQATENRYQVRAPSQRVETVVQPYVNVGEKKYVNTNAPQYSSIPPEQIYHSQNFRSSPQITQAQTQAFYSVY